jgi:hypothetical protein
MIIGEIKITYRPGGGGGAKWCGGAQPMLNTANIAASTIIDVIFFIAVAF